MKSSIFMLFGFANIECSSEQPNWMFMFALLWRILNVCLYVEKSYNVDYNGTLVILVFAVRLNLLILVDYWKQGLEEKIELVPLDLLDRPSWYKEKINSTNKVRYCE